LFVADKTACICKFIGCVQRGVWVFSVVYV